MHACLPYLLAPDAPSGMAMPLPAVSDAEGIFVPAGLPPIVDAHVHLFPDRVFEAIWRWFDDFGWPIRYKLTTPKVLDFLFARGVERVVALHYAHVPGMARMLNAYMAEVVKSDARVTGTATVLPGEPNAIAILEEAWASGLRGVKLHCHVQCFAPDDDALSEIYDACSRAGQPLVMHAGREPKSDALKCDPHLLCGAERTERVLRAYPKLSLCVPHLGADEFDAYERLLERHDNLWLDTTMMLAGYFPGIEDTTAIERLVDARGDRIFYGTDFPNLPYAWDRELARIARFTNDATLPALLGESAKTFFGIG